MSLTPPSWYRPVSLLLQRNHVAIVRAVGRMPLVCAVSAARSLVVGRMLKRWQPLLLKRRTLQRLAG